MGFSGAREEGKAWIPSFELAWFLESLLDPMPSLIKEKTESEVCSNR